MLGRVVDGDVLWSPERVPLDGLPEQDQQAARDGRSEDADPVIALRAVAVAVDEQGG